MGKSPGKWIKTILLGKKSSKSNFSKGREKVGNEKEVWVAAEALKADMAMDYPMSSSLTQSIIQKNEGKLEENGESVNSPSEEGISGLDNRDAHTQEVTEQDSPKDPERIGQEQAATKAQAALRGYLARRAFRALKGIIKLQALVRGHLVRRQAVSTLHCMLGIVKLQALARGRKVRQSYLGIEVQNKCILMKPLQDKMLVDPVGVNTSKQIAKLPANAFARKLLTSSPTARPLHLRYYSMELNSVLHWLECWSTSRFWKPIPQREKVPGPKSPRKQANSLHVDSEPSRLMQSIRKIPAVSVDSVSMHSTTEFEKPKRYLRKISTHSIDIVPENPEHELEKVKRSLRKVHNPIVESTVQSEIESEKSRSSLRKVSSPSGQNGVDHSTSDNAEKMETETAMTQTKLPDVEKIPEPVAVKKAIHLLQDAQTAVDMRPLENMGEDGKISGKNGESGLKDEFTSNDNQKSGRKASFPAKQERIDNESQSRPAVPSYMAATQSAKARLRRQGSPGLGQDGPDKHNLDGPDKHNLTRRYSLPSSTISKTTSQSPRAQRPVQSPSKGGNRSDRSLLSSRDGNVKVSKAEWRR